MAELILLCLTFMTYALGSNGLNTDGCETDWMAHGSHCYRMLLGNLTFNQSESSCIDYGAHLTSLWSHEEFEFLRHHLWKTLPEDKFVWIGLKGTPSNKWQWTDDSRNLKLFSSGIPAVSDRQCAALWGHGNKAYLDCNFRSVLGYICKKSLVTVYGTGDMYNPSGAARKLRSIMFEKAISAKLPRLPSKKHKLGTASVLHDTGCAFRCFKIPECRVFTLECVTKEECKDLTCTIFSSL